MRNQKGITLVSLVVTIIILIILAGISINALIGQNGIITRAQQAKENIILAQKEEQRNLNELYSQLDNIEDSSGNTGNMDREALKKLIEFKSEIATAITNAGVATLETDSTERMVENIGKILELGTDGTATPEDILEGKTAWVNGEKITGNMSNIVVATFQIMTSQAGNLKNNVVHFNDLVADNNNSTIVMKKAGKISFYGCSGVYNVGDSVYIYINDEIIYSYTSKAGYEYIVYSKQDIEVEAGDEIHVVTNGGKPGYYVTTNSTTVFFQ